MEDKIIEKTPIRECPVCNGTIYEYVQGNDLEVRRWWYQCDSCKKYFG
jgi:uncharacterized protein with PIN domain